MKKNLILAGLCSLLVFACTKAPQEELPKDPVFEVGETEISVEAAGGIYEATYTIDNPTPTGLVDAFPQVEWITIVNTQSYGIISFEVAANEEETPREGVIEMVYEGIERSVKVVQEAGEVGVGADYIYNATDVSGFYYAFQFSDVPNYYFHLSQGGFDANNNPAPNTWYYCIDLYSIVEPQSSDVVLIPNGVYELDLASSSADGTFSAGYSLYYETDAVGEVAKEARFTEGTLTITDEGMHLLVTDDKGKTHSVKYEGNNYSLMSINNDEPDIPVLDNELTSLTSDVNVNSTNMYISTAYYGDYYKNNGANWVFYFMPEGGNGDMVQIDVNSGVTGISADISGTYQCSATSEHFTFLPGEYFSGYFLGSWYLQMKNGAVDTEGEYAAFMDGTLVVTKNADDSYSFELEAFDANTTPFCITMSFTGKLTIADYSIPGASMMKKGF